jgi:hypothetical protein
VADLDSFEDSKATQSLFQRLLSNTILQTIVASVAVLIIEYRVFQKPNTERLVSPIAFVITLFLALYFITSCWKAVVIRLNQRLHFREDFAFHASCSILALISIGVLSFFTQLMFWNIFEQIAKTLLGQESPVSPISLIDYAVLLLLIMLLSVIASQWHSQWNGRRSTEHHRQEQNSEYPGLWGEGASEVRRRYLKLGQPPLLPYRGESQALVPLQLTPQEILSWAERAKELFRLSSPSYAFDPKSGWHDLEGCWVGENVKTEHLVFLYPAQVNVTQENLERFEQYARQVSDRRDKPLGELIVAFLDDAAKTESFLESDIYRSVTEQSLLENLVDFTDYRNEIRKRVAVNVLPDVTDIHLTVKDVYVDSQFSFLRNGHKSTESVETHLLKWLNEVGQRQIAVLGDYGQGKSTTMLMFTYRLLCESDQLPERIPILIELRGKSPKTLRPLELLGAWAAQYRIEPQALMQLHYAGRIILIFEGFDEMAMVSNVEMRLSHFKTLWQFCYPGAKIVITGRPNFFLDDAEKQKALGIYRPQGNAPYSEAIKIEPFTLGQIRAALRNHTQVVSEQICALAEKKLRFIELVSRPSLLHIVADLWEKERLSEKAESLNSAGVMKLFVDRSYRRQGRKEGDARRFMALNSAERDYFMQGIAAYMAAEELNNQITGEELTRLIDKLISAIPESVSTEPSITAGEEQRPLSQRLKEPEDYEDVKTDVRTCGLLVDDPAASNTFKFGHKSFMEYLFACTVSGYLEPPKGSEKARAIFKATVVNLLSVLKLPVSIGFLAELLCINQDFRPTESALDSAKSSDQIEADLALNLLRRIAQKENMQYYRALTFFGALPLSLGRTSSIDKLSIFTLFFDRFENFNSSIAKALKNNGKTYRFLLLLSSAFVCISILVSVLSMAPVKLIYISAFSLGVVPVILLNFIMSLSIEKLAISLNKLIIWNTICKDIGIQDRILHEVVGMGKLPWVKNRPFDYFLYKPHSSFSEETIDSAENN